MFSDKLFPVLYFIFIKSNNCKEQMEDFASCNKEKDRLCIPVVLNLIIVLFPVRKKLTSIYWEDNTNSRSNYIMLYSTVKI